MSASSSRSLRLSFKGDKPAKRKRRRDEGDRGEGSSRKRKEADVSDVEDVGGDEQAWVLAETLQDLTGPCFIMHQSEWTGDTHCVAVEPNRQRIEAGLVVPSTDAALVRAKEELAAANPDPRIAIMAQAMAEHPDKFPPEPGQPSGMAPISTPIVGDPTLLPTSVHHVWVVNQIRQRGADEALCTFKSAQGRFLGAERSGGVRADQEARGPQELWEVGRASGGFWTIYSTTHHGYLGFDNDAEGKRVVRSDRHDNHFEANLVIKVQWKHRHAARHPVDPNAAVRVQTNDPTAVLPGTRDQTVAREVETFRSRAGSQYVPANYGSSLSKEERRALRKAEKEGRLAEEMLDRRSKLKSDKYA
ncbi:FRG1-like protein [Kalmanozyma brasiliensis GHG001]|uniref:FRG1-like family protein n=1 Tax=Kalmanozyma brasiliensis (strain GHG001) TaxID=1365824 RepID=V5F3P0_KALBG|nr:FRG1-like protein [Kalmanozyma brasiliensis GHG001]EST10159.1 FRG1-like protein [Kalmanozyma brasiliensis GHG001]